MRDALAEISQIAESLIRINQGDTVLDIGCNDGTLLSTYTTKGIKKIGFDPAENLFQYSTKISDITICDFFSAKKYYESLNNSFKKPKIITSIAMFYDLDDPKKFVSDIKEIMDPNGIWIIQMSYLPLMLKMHEIGNICHEHLEYYSLHSLSYLLKLYDFQIVDAEINDINGGSIRVIIRNNNADPNVFGDDTYRKLAKQRVESYINAEIKENLDDIFTYINFKFWVERVKRDVVGFIEDVISKGKKVYVYGASTKGNTVLQYYGLNNQKIIAAAERNPDKWGKLTVGTNIPIISEEQARNENPDYFLVLPWHFINEFIEREYLFLQAGGRFIMPAPYFSLI
jgi:SAM-dependent methyltransferase